jgi:hypothetical protein
VARSSTQATLDPALTLFAKRLHDQLGAQKILLFGSHARGSAGADSDYDVIIVAEHFSGIERPHRAVCLRQLWYQSGGDAPMDLICLTQSEFAQAQEQITMVAAALSEAVDLLSPP